MRTMPGCTRPSSCVSKGSEVSRISPGDKSLAATTGSRFNKRRRREAMLCRRQHLHPDACEGPSLDTPTTTCRSACRRDELAARPIANLGVSASERFAQSHQVTYWLICHPGEQSAGKCRPVSGRQQLWPSPPSRAPLFAWERHCISCACMAAVCRLKST